MINRLTSTIAIAALWLGVAAQSGGNATIADHEDEIYSQEQLIDAKQDTIKVIEDSILVLKAHIDSLNRLEKELKGQISALEKQKKTMQNDIKTASKAREAAFDRRDNLVYETEVLDVLMMPFNKQAVDEALKSFEGMETKDVLKKRELVENYGSYTHELREFMNKQKAVFAAAKWKYTGTETPEGKKFHKALKSTDYYKIYEKGIKNSKNATIPYLDEVIEDILQLEHSGFTSEKQYDAVAAKLYE